MITSKQKTSIRDAVFADKVTFRKDGSIEFKRAYFYRMGMSADIFAERVRTQIQSGTNFQVTDVEATDRWAAWPRTSYFVATVRVA